MSPSSLLPFFDASWEGLASLYLWYNDKYEGFDAMLGEKMVSMNQVFKSSGSDFFPLAIIYT